MILVSESFESFCYDHVCWYHVKDMSILYALSYLDAYLELKFTDLKPFAVVIHANL